ncbi:uncharacterized protein [Panulirus ornatus]|uniref:uncharacterized protein n=1 Tax=Panulirus ornatus TaxID=150431 RepID=UPI003A852DFD
MSLLLVRLGAVLVVSCTTARILSQGTPGGDLHQPVSGEPDRVHGGSSNIIDHGGFDASFAGSEAFSSGFYDDHSGTSTVYSGYLPPKRSPDHQFNEDAGGDDQDLGAGVLIASSSTGSPGDGSGQGKGIAGDDEDSVHEHPEGVSDLPSSSSFGDGTLFRGDTDSFDIRSIAFPDQGDPFDVRGKSLDQPEDSFSEDRASSGGRDGSLGLRNTTVHGEGEVSGSSGGDGFLFVRDRYPGIYGGFLSGRALPLWYGSSWVLTAPAVTTADTYA